ncbi:hypothetical protein E2C01_071903 [Portunus trituberculatus]|uniref:Uncharacterized protein n=1 Tax=Portunus trituberculatus TaxID=210409 RepID=A0A5B7I6C9_PORTR|nr:hypothetical protein [Portunus trituberculatus]
MHILIFFFFLFFCFFYLFIPCGLFTGISGLKELHFALPSIYKPTHQETIAPSEEAQPTLGPWTGFKPMRLEAPQTPKHAWFHCTTADPMQTL